ncbi:LADA_0A06766g1_1 [Lachancea dasiensis]|uniref:Ribosome quality control complex subunit 2 n=1 Tax=Lachancea dasiensis TaxID=1072105 RepID=A0A1G4IPP5_9SACH|nr:LADA_0A06766g1_1 [Lachancea dasiensis]
MKQRISSLDLQILYPELKSHLEGYRLANIYNIADSSRQFLLKFNKPESKLNAIIDCGLRIHLTDFNRPIPSTPSGFVVKLRKHLKSKRLTTVKRVPGDRILVLSFSDGQYFLVLEFFSAGNVILLDAERKIVALQRIVHEHENKVGQTYDMFGEDFLNDTGVVTAESKAYDATQVLEWLTEAEDLARSTHMAKKGKLSRVPSIQKLLFLHEPHLSSDLISRNLKQQGIAPNSSCLEFKDKCQLIADLLNATEFEVNDLLRSGCKKGFIVSKKNPAFDPEKGDSNLEFIYEQFHPFPIQSQENDEREMKVIEVAGEYNKTVDSFFSTIESSKYALRIQSQEHQAKKRLAAAKSDNQKRIQALVDVQAKNEARGHAIIANAALVEEAQNAVRTLVDQQMDWKTIEILISNEQKKRNEVAQLIKLPLDLENNKITLVLESMEDVNDPSAESEKEEDSSSDFSDSEEDTSDDGPLSDFEADEDGGIKEARSSFTSPNLRASKSSVDATIDLSLSAYANASNYFNLKKSTMEKQKKVEQNANKALRNIEQRIERDLKKKLKESHDVLIKTRTPYFFEKYHWFISSEGFLVLMGKSGQESDQIFSKYIEDDDVFVSNSFDTRVWIKNPHNTEVPPNTLMQAGIMCMAASPAWSKKMQSSAWWCFAKNLSKFDNHGGEVLSPGNFQLLDEKAKSFLPPSQLVLGFGFLWKVKENLSEEESAFEDNREDACEVSMINLNGNHDQEVNGAVDDNSPEIEIEALQEGVENLGVIDRGNEPEIVTEEAQAEASHAPHDVFAKVDSPPKIVRGKKGKLKKMQRKYADQDEEERKMRLEALGTLKGVQRQKSKQQEEMMKQQEREENKMKRERQKKQQSLKFSSKEKVVINYDKVLDELSPIALNSETVKEVIPVLAPWPALNKYKYKVKLQPGNAKKTKTLHEIMHYFSSRKVDASSVDKNLDWPCEHELIKTLKDTELVPVLYTDKLKVTIPGQLDSRNSSKGGATSKGKRKGKN